MAKASATPGIANATARYRTKTARTTAPAGTAKAANTARARTTNPAPRTPRRRANRARRLLEIGRIDHRQDDGGRMGLVHVDCVGRHPRLQLAHARRLAGVGVHLEPR